MAIIAISVVGYTMIQWPDTRSSVQNVENPDESQRAQFVVANLLHALKTDNEQVAGAMCSYLAIRMPDLKQLKINEQGEEVSIEFDFENEYVNQVAVQLH